MFAIQTNPHESWIVDCQSRGLPDIYGTGGGGWLTTSGYTGKSTLHSNGGLWNSQGLDMQHGHAQDMNLSLGYEIVVAQCRPFQVGAYVWR